MKKRTTIFASNDKEINKAISALVEKKTGLKFPEMAHSNPEDWAWVVLNRHGCLGRNGSKYEFKEITLEELCEMPDYQPVKEMTLPEVIKELGYEIKIVK